MADSTVTINIPSAASAPAATPKPGYASTEFGVTIAAALALGAGLVPPQYAGAFAALVGVYAACRTLLKAAHALGYAKQVPDLPDLPPGLPGSTTTTITSIAPPPPPEN